MLCYSQNANIQPCALNKQQYNLVARKPVCVPLPLMYINKIYNMIEILSKN